MNPVAESLLAAHVEHELSAVRGEGLGKLIEELVVAQFEWLKGVTLNDVATREHVVGVIQRNVIDLKVSGGITELAGEMANSVFSSKWNAATTVRDICSTQSYEDFADKIVGLRGVQRELIGAVMRSSASATLTSRVLSRFAMNLVFGEDGTESPSLLRMLLAALGHKLVPDLERRAEELLSHYAEQHATRFTKEGAKHVLEVLDPEWVRQMADELWDAVSSRPIAEATSVFSAQDLEDFVVLGYEFWQRFRKTPYFKAVAGEVVDRLFTKYGDDSLNALILDMGVTEAMLTLELRLLLEPICAHAIATGQLEQQIRAHLEPFYRSLAVTRILGP
jgi:hypothetical protein